MSTAIIKRIEEILTAKFDMDSYVQLVNELLDGVKPAAPNRLIREYSNFTSHMEGYTHVGTYVTPQKKKLLVLAVELKSMTYVENSRSVQRSYAKRLIENAGADAAMVAFHTPKDERWRLSFVRLDYEMKIENGRMKTAESLTPARRYSFLVGRDEPCHTAIERFYSFIQSKNATPSLDELEEAFSVERVTGEFFSQYCEKFQQLREALEANEDFRIEAEQHSFTSAQFAKKLMGQIVFLYFLQKKGWLGVNAWPPTMNAAAYKRAYFAMGAKSRELIPQVYRQVDEDTWKVSNRALVALSNEDEAALAACVEGLPWGTGPRNFMRKLFDAAEQRGANFFDSYLQPLFYDALNRNRGKQGYDPALHCRIPFLSGGLFEPIDGYDWQHNHFDLPNAIFSNRSEKGERDADGILDIFDRYNFTMSEDEPMEREVAIDPEMLGKVFENLLDVTDRKSKGAFYTPREIVHYMCRESLINYLTNALGVSEPAIRDFILYGDVMTEQDGGALTVQKDGSVRVKTQQLLISEELYRLGADGKPVVDRMPELDRALADVRVADPAVGSGAFPLGMLNEIVRARQSITTYIGLTLRATDPRNAARRLRNMMIDSRNAHRLKYETVRDCIFAADIEPSAVDIAQLRLWLALVIDDEINPTAQDETEGHREPMPLPNLECNILCGNSLIDEFEGIRLINESDLLGNAGSSMQINYFQYGLDELLERLIEKQGELYRCEDTAQKQVLLREIASLKDRILAGQLEGASKETLARFEESKRMASKPYVLWQLDFARVFRAKRGFDIVIGNPPYLAYKKIANQVKDLYNRVYQCSSGQYDLYGVFIERGYQLLRKGGTLAYITSNTYFNNKDFKKLRQYLLENTKIKTIVNLDETIFKTAQLDVAIICFEKMASSNEADNYVTILRDKEEFISQRGVRRKQQAFNNEELSYEFKLKCSDEDDALIAWINEGSVKLGTIMDLPRGIEIGGNSSLIHTESILGGERILVGRNLKRYYIEVKEQYIVFDYSDTSCFKSHDIYCRPKILIQRIRNLSLKQRIVATIDLSNYLCTNTLRIGYLTDESFDLYYILGILNSKLINWLFLKYFLNKDIYSYQLQQIPIKIASPEKQNEIALLVKQVLDQKSTDGEYAALEIERVIDQKVYDLYGISITSRQLVEQTCK